MKRPGFRIGALVGALTAASLAGIFYAAWKLAGLAFVPFQIFDFVARVLPGPVITFGIDSMVKVIRVLGIADTASAAKAAEQIMAILMFLAAGALAGGSFFRYLRGGKRREVAAGGVLGLAVGICVVLLARSLSEAPGSRTLSHVWTIAAFLVWGISLALIHRRLAPAAIGSPPPRGEAAPPVAERLDRRRFLIRFGGATATITVLGAVVGNLARRASRRETDVVAGRRWSADNPLPNAGATLQPAPGTRPELTPLENHYRIDISTTPPVIDPDTWRLKIGGLVASPLELTLEEIRSFEATHQFVTLACISNPLAGSLIGTTRWSGVSFQQLLPRLGLKPEATHLRLRSADKFDEIVALEKIRSDPRVLLAYDWDGVPLTAKHGFPLRIYIPDLYGMKQPKWIQSIEALDKWEPGYWVRRGWDKVAQMRAGSVIDTVSVDMMLSEANKETRIPIGGIAHAGARGISRVEVRVDDGPWEEARLRDPLSPLTWVLWRYDWPFRPGSHTFAVRCVDGSGDPQIPGQSPPHPSGATGLHSKSMML
ncbi:MAG TPA: molybdopterin-dependent oxidoreductase [Thermoanaerobaculia bacterium]